MAPSKPPLAKRPIILSGQPERKSKKYIPWIFVTAATIAIGLMIFFNPKEKKLVCQNNAGVTASLISFGTCSEDQSSN